MVEEHILAKQSGIAVGMGAVEHLESLDDLACVVVRPLVRVLLLLVREVLEIEFLGESDPGDLEVVILVLHHHCEVVDELLRKLEPVDLRQLRQGRRFQDALPKVQAFHAEAVVPVLVP